MIVKIWPIKAAYGTVQMNLKNSLDYIKDSKKTAKNPAGQDLAEEFDNLAAYEKDELTFENFSINNVDSFNRVLSYAANEDKTDGYISGYLCSPEKAVEEFLLTKEINLERVGKTLEDDTGNQAYHIVQSFPEELDISDEEIHRCGQELAERIGLHQALICSHVHPVTDEEQEVHGRCKHNHIIINSHIYHKFVDEDNPRKMKYNDCNETYALLQLYNDEIAIEHGLPIILSPDSEKSYSWFETEEKNKGKSWKERVRQDIANTIRVSGNYEEYKNLMYRAGYTMREGTSKEHGDYITYTTPNNKKVRDYVLGKNSTLGYINSYWSLRENIAKEIQDNEEAQNRNSVEIIASRVEGRIFVNIQRQLGGERKKRLADMGRRGKQSFNYALPLPTKYDEDFSSEKSYFEPEQEYEIVDDKNQPVATVLGRDILNYYNQLEEITQNTDDRTNDGEIQFYYNNRFINRKTSQPYKISMYKEDGRRYNMIELLILLAVVILRKEDEYLGIEQDDLTEDQRRSPIYAQRSQKLQNMAEALRVAREEQIKAPAEIDERLNKTGKNIAKARAEIRRLTQAQANMESIKNMIDQYKDVQPLCENIWNMEPGPEKEAMKKQHEEQINVYNEAKAFLYKNNIKNETDIEDFTNRQTQFAEKIEETEEKLDVYKEEYRRLSKLRYSIQLAQNKQYVYGPKVEEKEPVSKQQEQEKRSIEEEPVTQIPREDEIEK